MKKRLTKSASDKKIEGVCGGIAEYFNIDPTVVRLVYILASVFTGGFPGIIVYIAFSLAMPNDDGKIETTAEEYKDSEEN